MPPVITSRSRPPALAAIAPTSRRSRWTNTSKARARPRRRRVPRARRAGRRTSAGQPLQPRLRAPARRRARPRRPRRAQQPQQQARVERAGPRRHHQPAQRGEAHGGVHRAPAPHRRQRGAGTQVAGDHRAGRRRARPTISAARRTAYAWERPWKPYRRSAHRSVPLPGQRVGAGGRRQVGVEGGVEAGHRRQVRQQPAPPRGCRATRPRVVQRREVARSSPGSRAASSSTSTGRGVPRPAVHDAVADRVDAADALDELADRLEVTLALPALHRGRRDHAVALERRRASGCSSRR